MSASGPREPLSFTYSRRSFWRGVVQEVLVVSGLLKGGQECRLSDLGSLPDDQLARMRPIVHPACEIFVDGDGVWSRCKATGAVDRLFALEETGKRVALGMFDGEHTLGEVGRRLAGAMEWDELQGFAHARDLFLSLARRLICVPLDPSAPDQQGGFR